MTDTNRIARIRWTRERAALLAVVCLAAGIGGGWSIRGLRASTPAAGTNPVAAPVATTAKAPAPAQLKDMADTQAVPLLDKLKSDPTNPDLLVSLGNLYYDAQQYAIAVDYYGRALKGRPADAAVRTDMGTAYWYMGNADLAISEFNMALSYSPDNANTLFNLGLVKWKGKMDGAGAVADWKKLLAANPNYEGKDKVQQMMNEAMQAKTN